MAVGTLDGEVVQTRNDDQNASLDDDSGDESDSASESDAAASSDDDE